MSQDPFEQVHLISQVIFDKKGFNILALDVRGISTLTDFFIIAEGNADRHVKAIAESVMEALDHTGYPPCHVEGLDSGDWVVLDYIDFVIHLFKPGLRDRYRLEELWKDGMIIPLNLKVGIGT